MRIVLYIIFAAIAAGATVDTLQPDATLGKDAFVYEDTPTQNFGESDHLSITSSTNGHQAVSYIKFVQLDSYFGTTIHQATLELYVTDLGSTYTNLKYGATMSDWNETTITWQNQPWDIPGTEEQEPYPSDIGIWWSVDVTGTVLDWANDTNPHHGFILFDDFGLDDMVRFASSDEPNSTYWPKLIIDYTGDIGVNSTSLGELKASFQ